MVDFCAPIVIVVLSGTAVEITGCSLIVHHRQMCEARAGEREVLHKQGEIRYLVLVDPEHAEVGEVGKPGVRVQLV